MLLVLRSEINKLRMKKKERNKKKSVNIYLIVLDVELKKYLIDTKKKEVK